MNTIEPMVLSDRPRDHNERGTRSAIVLDAGQSPVFVGGEANAPGGEYDIICGECGTKVGKSLDLSGISGYVVKCAECDSYNDLRQPSAYLDE